MNLSVQDGSAPTPTCSTLTGQAIWDALRTGSETIRTRTMAMFTPAQAWARLGATMSNMWAETTLQDRRSLVNRWIRWCTKHNLQQCGASATLFIASNPNLRPQGQLAYAKALSGVFRQLSWDRTDLLALASALRAQGAEIPEKQAEPLKKEHLEQWLATLADPLLKLAAMVCWKTASRWGETALLTRENFISVEPEEIIVAWGTLPKGRRADPYTPSMYTVIVGQWTGEIARLLQLVPTQDQPFCPWPTERLDAELKNVPCMAAYTGHSFKKGAATHVIRAAARNPNLGIKPQEISVLLKHKLTYDLLSSSDLRYPEAGPHLARFLGTQRATLLL